MDSTGLREKMRQLVAAFFYGFAIGAFVTLIGGGGASLYLGVAMFF